MVREEINKKLQEIMKTSGVSAPKQAGKLEEILKSEFDEAAYDRQMAQLFNEEYYQKEDDEEELKKYVEDLENKIDGKIDWSAVPKDLEATGDAVEEAMVEERPAKKEKKKEVQKTAAVEAKESVGEASSEPLPIWWYCDRCGRTIQPLESRYDCTECEDYTECKECAKDKTHEHVLKKFQVPASRVLLPKMQNRLKKQWYRNTLRN
jgi:protein KRI1